MANSYLTRTPSSTTNRKTFTISYWCKRSSISSNYPRICAYDYADTDRFEHFFNNVDQLYIEHVNNNSQDVHLVTSRKFRDTSAWYHIVVAFDTTQATASNRVKLYINGVQETNFTGTVTYPSQDSNMIVNYASGSVFYIGETGYSSGGQNFDGYMSHVAFVDGQALAPTVFGETDSTSGIWKFKSPSGVTWGTNGFHLKMENSAALGTDSSGNTNTFTVNGNLKQALDTPSNVYCTANPLSKGSNITLTNGNLTITKGSGFESCMATLMPSAGKWYWENKVSSLGTINCGVTKSTQDGTTHSSVDAGRSMYSSNGTIYNEGLSASNISTGTTFTTNDIIGVALDIDGNTIKFYKNGTLIDTVSDSGISSAEGWSPAWGMSSGAFNVNFGNGFFGTTAISSAGSNGNGSLFEYDVPSGYYALNTKNINTYG